jgi:peptidyl-prolyl cis-trans isomerase C
VYRIALSFLVASVLVSGAACRKKAAPGATAAGAQGASAQPSTTTPAAPQPPKPMPAQLPDVVARVNGEAVSKADFDRLVKNMELGNGPIPAEQRDRVLRDALDQLVTYTLLKQEAKTRNITVSDTDVEARVKQMQGQFPDPQAFEKALAERGMSVDRLRSDAHVDMAINKMLEGEVATLPGPSDAQAREFYDKNPDKFKQPESVRASHILILADEKTDAATKKKARQKIEALLKRARGGADFAKLARENSQDSSAQQGGDLNYFPRGQMVPPFDEAAFSLKPGQISGIVTTQFGYHIIKVTDRKPASTVAFEQVSDRIKQYLTEQGKQNHAKAFIDGLKGKSKIEVLV